MEVLHGPGLAFRDLGRGSSDRSQGDERFGVRGGDEHREAPVVVRRRGGAVRFGADVETRPWKGGASKLERGRAGRLLRGLFISQDCRYGPQGQEQARPKGAQMEREQETSARPTRAAHEDRYEGRQENLTRAGPRPVVFSKNRVCGSAEYTLGAGGEGPRTSLPSASEGRLTTSTGAVRLAIHRRVALWGVVRTGEQKLVLRPIQVASQAMSHPESVSKPSDRSLDDGLRRPQPSMLISNLSIGLLQDIQAGADDPRSHRYLGLELGSGGIVGVTESDRRTEEPADTPRVSVWVSLDMVIEFPHLERSCQYCSETRS